MNILPHIEINPERKADSTIIWLHGLGSNGHDFKAIIPELELSTHNRTRFIFPHAPTISVTINSGHMMPAWYDILEMTFDRKIDKKVKRTSARPIATGSVSIPQAWFVIFLLIFFYNTANQVQYR